MEDRLTEREAIEQLTIKKLMKHCMVQCRKFPNKRAGYEHYIFLQLLKNAYPRDIEDYIIDYSLICRGELDEDNEEFSDYEPEYIEINKEDISIGDYIGIECERFAEPCHLRIIDIQQRYNEMTGEPYKIIIDEENEIWSTQSGGCLSNPKTFL